MASDLAEMSAAAALAGVATHYFYFRLGEHHSYGTSIVQVYVTLVLLLATGLFQIFHFDLVAGVVVTLAVTAVYFSGLFGSMLLYRGVFHPLKKFQGPPLAKLSNLYHSSLLKESDNYLLMEKLHKQYGPIVRTGVISADVGDQEGLLTGFRTLESLSKCARSCPGCLWFPVSVHQISLV